MTPVNKVGIDAVPVIQDLAERTCWKTAYSSVISPEQMRYMLGLFYSEASLKKQMQDGHQFIIAKENQKAIGFASYSAKPESPEEPAVSQNSGKDQDKAVEVITNVYRLHKIYVDPDQQGKGLGKLLIGFVINDISTYDATHLELNVNRHSKAVEFYQKIGFKIIGEEYINIGNGYFMNDFIMSLTLQTYA